MNESLFCVRVTASVRRTTWIKQQNTNTEISFLNVFYSVVYLNMLSLKKNIYFKTNSHH